MIADPAHLRHLARQATGHADDLRAEARRLRGGAAVRWRSLAADRFRDRLAALAAAADEAGAHADHLAGALRREADDVERERARLAALAATAVRDAEGLAVRAGAGLAGGARVLGGVLSDGLPGTLGGRR